MNLILIGTFIIGYLCIVFEHPLKLDKTVPALIIGMLSWVIVSAGAGTQMHQIESSILHHLGKITEILIFLIGAMTIVELIDAHKGFSIITQQITTGNKIKLLWIVSWLSFLLSSVLDNLTTTIIFISLLKQLIKDRSLRIWYVSFVVIAANAGGAWSPIGDVTTTMLWIAKKVTTYALIKNLITPSIICLLIPLIVASVLPVFKGELEDSKLSPIKQLKSSKVMLIAGVLSLVFVPIFKTITHLAPWMGMMFSLSVLWLISEYVTPVDDFEEVHRHEYTVRKALTKIEMPSILFFLGILMAITALEYSGVLATLSGSLDTIFSNRNIVATFIGILSAIIDNVPLVAAAISMYTDTLDAHIWHFFAFSAGTGGSMLIIGSAAGVAAMGLEKIDFIWYLKRMSWIAAIGFLAGCLYISFFT